MLHKDWYKNFNELDKVLFKYKSTFNVNDCCIRYYVNVMNNPRSNTYLNKPLNVKVDFWEVCLFYSVILLQEKQIETSGPLQILRNNHLKKYYHFLEVPNHNACTARNLSERLIIEITAIVTVMLFNIMSIL